MSSIKSQTINSLKWSTIERLGQFAAQIVINIILSRILNPDQYAIIGILNMFILISNVLVDAGFSQGLIRKLDCTKEDYNSVFWFNLLSSFAIYGILYFSMPLIANFFNDQQLIKTGRVLMIVIPLQALNVVQTTIVNKELDFKKIAKYTVLAFPISGTIGILLAVYGYGVWALIWQTLVNALLLVVVFWFTSWWKPSFKISLTPIKELFGFSFRLSASSFLNALFNNLYGFIIAKLYSKSDMGYYTQAQKYGTMPTNIIESILNRMTYPLLSRLQNDPTEYKALYKKLQISLFALIIPLMSVLALCASEGIIIVLGEKWEPSVLFFQLVCISGITLPFHPLCMSNLKVFGRSDIIFNLEILKKIAIVTLIAIFWSLGIVGLIISQAVFFWLALIFNMLYAGRQIKYDLRDQIKDVAPYFGFTIISVVCAIIPSLFFDNMFFVFSSKLVIFVAVYIGLLKVTKQPEAKFISEIIGNFKHKN